MATEKEEEKIFKYLKEHGSADFLLLAREWNEDHQKIVGAVKSLLCLGNVIEADLKSSSQWVLTDEGPNIVSDGSHGDLVFNAVPAGGITQAEIEAKILSANVGIISKAMSNGWIAMKKSSGTPKIIWKTDQIEDKVQKHLTQFDELDAPLKAEYKKRKLIQEITVKSYQMRAGSSFTKSVKKQDTYLTPEMISSGSWKEKTLKPFNLHPQTKVRSEFRQIFLEMGFSEMPTNNSVESSFWNFDAQFQPQQHPARDAHDTFFISDPSTASGIPEYYMERVKKVHP